MSLAFLALFVWSVKRMFLTALMFGGGVLAAFQGNVFDSVKQAPSLPAAEPAFAQQVTTADAGAVAARSKARKTPKFDLVAEKPPTSAARTITLPPKTKLRRAPDRSLPAASYLKGAAQAEVVDASVKKWIKVRTSQGIEGWVRLVDIEREAGK